MQHALHALHVHNLIWTSKEIAEVAADTLRKLAQTSYITNRIVFTYAHTFIDYRGQKTLSRGSRHLAQIGTDTPYYN
eukprot:scaffold158707_cov26-Tisochrysis_lutea.AAC.1